MIFVAKIIMFLCPIFAYGLLVPKCISGGLITILYVLEVFILDKCLIFL
jgi:hypothetical protein